MLGTDTGKVQLFEVGELKNEFDVTLPTASDEEATRTASGKSLQRYVATCRNLYKGGGGGWSTIKLNRDGPDTPIIHYKKQKLTQINL